MMLRKIKPPTSRTKVPRLAIALKIQRLPERERPFKRYAKLVKRRRRVVGIGPGSSRVNRGRDSRGGHLILLEQLRSGRIDVNVVHAQNLLQHVHARLQEPDVGLWRRAAAVVLGCVCA